MQRGWTSRLGSLVGGLLFFGTAASAAAQSFPPLCIEISPDHPLLVFETASLRGDDPAAYADKVIRAWGDLPENLKPYAVMAVAEEGESRHARYQALLGVLQQASVPVVVRITDADAQRADPRNAYPLNLAEELVSQFTCVKGIEAGGLAFNEFAAFDGGGDAAVLPQVRWLIGAVDVAARYGRFIAISLDELGWPRVMCNNGCRALYDKLRQCRDYVAPIAVHRGGHNVTQVSALMGLWLEGAAAQWGIGATSAWYTDARFLGPGVFGVGADPANIPSFIYRAMLLNGAMTGATVYAFSAPDDLWFGKQRRHWDQAIAPTLNELLARGLIAREEFVRKKVRVAFQLAPSSTPQEFHLNLRDIDPVFDQGLLLRGAYGVERPGQVTELILNSGRHYWVPLLSPYAPQNVREAFAAAAQPGAMGTAEAWTELLDGHYVPDGMGTAFICRVGRGVFVMNSSENIYEEQTYRIPSVPAPVRGLQAERRGNDVVLTWPFREHDVSYRIYRRDLPDGAFTLVAGDTDQRTWTDANVNPSLLVAYAVTALTSEEEAYEGAVNWGDCLAFSVVESRIAEEAAITPLLSRSVGQPLAAPQTALPKAQAWWPTLNGLTDAQVPVAQAIAQRIVQWDTAFSREDLAGVLDLYAKDYEDPQGWRLQYVQRAYEWFFQRYATCRMDRQIRKWDFGAYDTDGRVRVLLYCRFSGVAMSDTSGRVADLPAYFPRTDTGEVWLTLVGRENAWRIASADPALPNFNDILSFSVGPYDAFAPGPDTYRRP